ncbi:sigma-70 family RNA polymerase sigma factor [Dactylosporangium sp. NPDC049742]|uniref:RNA polymerase sigma factor n=1 Tax=Dactylosporangium sp. NPDC049742 TaxID=3154737 RepID=UPI00344571C9
MAQSDEVLVAAARDGDRAAVEALAARYLPLVYSVVGRGADRDLDVDDIVQDAMVRVVTGVSTVRQAGRFRSWVVTIALRQLADARAEARLARLTRGEDQPDSLPDTADPAADFVGLAVLRQVLDVEQRGIAEAARWLDPAHRTVLSLWWLEAGGHLTRAEVADALDLPAAHAGVRVQRMREQLDVARSVVRALDAPPGCPALREVVAGWAGEPDPLWRKRIARHVRDCPQCTERSRRLPAAEGLLACLPLLVPPPKATAGGWALKAFALAGGAAALALAIVVGVTVWRQPDEPRREVPAARPPATAQAPAPFSPAASPATSAPSVPPFFATVPAVPKVAEFAPAGAVRQRSGRRTGCSARCRAPPPAAAAVPHPPPRPRSPPAPQARRRRTAAARPRTPRATPWRRWTDCSTVCRPRRPRPRRTEPCRSDSGLGRGPGSGPGVRTPTRQAAQRPQPRPRTGGAGSLLPLRFDGPDPQTRAPHDP